MQFKTCTLLRVTTMVAWQWTKSAADSAHDFVQAAKGVVFGKWESSPENPNNKTSFVINMSYFHTLKRNIWLLNITHIVTRMKLITRRFSGAHQCRESILRIARTTIISQPPIKTNRNHTRMHQWRSWELGEKSAKCVISKMHQMQNPWRTHVIRITKDSHSWKLT